LSGSDEIEPDTSLSDPDEVFPDWVFLDTVFPD